jgi:hypothetical protein
MTSHELAQELLKLPNLDVLVQETCGCLLRVSSTFSREINDYDEEMCGDAEGRLGEEVVVIAIGS